MTNQEIINRLEQIKPGLENSSSAAEVAMVELLPAVIAALKASLKEPAEKIPAGKLTGFYKTKDRGRNCIDCIDGWCQMNCGPVCGEKK